MTPQPQTEASDPGLMFFEASAHDNLVSRLPTEDLRYLVTNAQVDAIERTLINSLVLQRTLHCYTCPHFTLIEFGIPPLILQQALQSVALHFSHMVLHTNTKPAKLDNLR